jgi:hypothetical protein
MLVSENLGKRPKESSLLLGGMVWVSAGLMSISECFASVLGYFSEIPEELIMLPDNIA